MFTLEVPSEGALMRETVPGPSTEEGGRTCRGVGVGGQETGTRSRKPAWEALELYLLNSAGVQPAEKGRVWRVTLPRGLHEGSWGREELSQLQESSAVSYGGKERALMRDCSLSVSTENSTKHCHI